MAPKARLYKYVTPPAIKGGATIQIGGKTVAGPSVGFTQLIKATNSLGATVNSIAIIVEDLNKTFASNMKLQMKQTEDMFKLREKQSDKIQSDKKKQEGKQRKAEGLKQDEKAEATQEKKKSIVGSVAGTVGKAAAFGLGFLKGIFDLFGSIFKAVVMYNVLDWISKPENLKKVESMIKSIKSIAQFIFKFVETFVNLGLGGLADFLENPLSLKGLFGILKFVVALGLLFNPLGMAKLGIQLVVRMFRGGKLIKLLTGLFRGIGGMIKGLMAFVKARGLGGLLLGGALLFGVGAAAEMIPGAIGTETDKLVDESEKTEEEKIKTLEDQLKSLSFWDKLWGKDAEIKEQIERVKTGEDPRYGMTGKEDKAEEKSVPEGYFRASNGEILEEPNLFAKGGPVPITPFVPKFGGAEGFAKGGWINGPQSGYPVSLDGGRSTSFIGHGTEWVGYPKGYANGGAFVVPFDTPATRGNKGLTSMRMRQAMSGGYNLPGFSMGGPMPTMNILPEFAGGGAFNPVLDLIAKYEAGAGGWESMYPSTRLKGATKMTISDVARKASGAVGMYQNLPQYLVARAKAVGLNPSKDLYNETNQRKIAEYLIGRGQAGVTADMMKNKPAEAMLRLSKVWAAIPVPYDTQGNRKRVKKGESYYAGVGSNKAHITPEMMYKAMGQVTGQPIDPKVMASANSDDLTAPSPDTGSGGPSSNATTEQKDPFAAAQENLLNVLNKWLPHTKEVPGPSSENTSGDKLNQAELTEQEENGKDGTGKVNISTAKIPNQGGNVDPSGTKTPDPVLLPNTYVIPANEFVKPRFGLMADVSTEPVSLY